MGEAADKMNTDDWNDRLTSNRDADDVYVTSESSDLEENPEQLRADIEDTRAEMSQTLNEIQERLSPEHLVGQVKETVREATVGKVERAMYKAGETIADATEPAREAMGRAGTVLKETGRSVADTVWRNPIPAALIGLGLGMLVMRSYRGDGRDYEMGQSDMYRRPRRRQAFRGDEMPYGEGMGATTRAGTNTRMDKGAGTLDQMKETASDLANRSTNALSNLGTRAKDTASTAGRRFREVLRENPLAVGAVAVAAGTAVGLALPSTRFENEYVGETSERLVDKAQEVAREAIDKVQNAAQQMTSEDQPRT